MPRLDSKENLTRILTVNMTWLKFSSEKSIRLEGYYFRMFWYFLYCENVSLLCFLQSRKLVTDGMQSYGFSNIPWRQSSSWGRHNLTGWMNPQWVKLGNFSKLKKKKYTKIRKLSDLGDNCYLCNSSAFEKCLNKWDPIRGEWCIHWQMLKWEEMWGICWMRAAQCYGVDVWYPPARTAPVRLLVEAEASPAFLRRARVWAQCTACTKQGGGKAKNREEQKKTKKKE